MQESSIFINITTMGDGCLPNSSMNKINNMFWYYDWSIPSGSDEDGPFIVKVYAHDNATNALLPFPSVDASKQIDNTIPTISSISVTNISSNSVTINWITNENTTSNIQYGPTVSYGSWLNGSDYGMGHSYSIFCLSSSTTYHFSIKSYDSAGNTNISADQTFQTSSIRQIISRKIIETSFENNSPSTPSIDGPTYGSIHVDYMYMVQSIDINNDDIRYTFDWGDGVTESSELMPSGSTYIQIHRWSTAGKYTIKVIASDSKADSSSEKIIWIDACPVGDLGYLLDSDSDGKFDIFHNDATGIETSVELRYDGRYLIDIDGDNRGDILYDAVSRMVLILPQQSSIPNTKPFPFLLLSVLIFVIAVFVIAVYRKRFLKK